MDKKLNNEKLFVEIPEFKHGSIPGMFINEMTAFKKRSSTLFFFLCFMI